MVGFPPENNYTGIGVFSHAIKLSHRMPAPLGTDVNEPRLLGTSAHVRLYELVLKLLFLLELLYDFFPYIFGTFFFFFFFFFYTCNNSDIINTLIAI